MPNPTVTALTLTTIGDIVVDATLSAVHTMEAETTDHPVEDGGDVTDGINVKTPSVRIDGLLRASDSAGVDYDGSQSRLTALFGQVVNITTAFASYTQMALQSLETHQDKTYGGAIPFTAVFKQIRYVTTTTTRVVKDPNVKPRVKTDPKPTTAAEGPENKQSDLLKGITSLVDNLKKLSNSSPAS